MILGINLFQPLFTNVSYDGDGIQWLYTLFNHLSYGQATDLLCDFAYTNPSSGTRFFFVFAF